LRFWNFYFVSYKLALLIFFALIMLIVATNESASPFISQKTKSMESWLSDVQRVRIPRPKFGSGNSVRRSSSSVQYAARPEIHSHRQGQDVAKATEELRQALQDKLWPTSRPKDIGEKSAVAYFLAVSVPACHEDNLLADNDDLWLNFPLLYRIYHEIFIEFFKNFRRKFEYLLIFENWCMKVLQYFIIIICLTIFIFP